MSADRATRGCGYALQRSDPDDVGARVVLRRRLPDGRLSDLLGELERWDDGRRPGARPATARSSTSPRPTWSPPSASRRRRPRPVSDPTRARFAEVVRSEPVDLGLACLLVGGEVEPDLDVDVGLAALDALAAAARPHVPPSARAAVAAAALRRALGEQAGFGGSAQDFDDLRSSLLHEVLLRRRGLPILLSVVWIEVAAPARGARATPSGCPAASSSAVGEPDDEHVLVDPFAGGRVLDVADVDALVRAATGGPLREPDLRPAAPDDLLLRLLTNVRVLATRRPPGLEAAAHAPVGGRAVACCSPATRWRCAASAASCWSASATTSAARTSWRRTPLVVDGRRRRRGADRRAAGGPARPRAARTDGAP